MNISDTLDFALGQLEGDAAIQATHQHESDPAFAFQVDRLSLAIGSLLEVDDHAYDPPAGLAERTKVFVETEIARRATTIDFPVSRPRFRREDLAVAATIFLASMIALAPAILKGRERWTRAGCQNNLQKVGMRLHQYAAVNGAYPFVASDEEVPYAGTIVCRLNDAGFPIEPRDLVCPCSGSSKDCPERVPHLSEVAETMKSSNEAGCRMFGTNDYAFNVGTYPSPSDHAKSKAGPLPALASHAIPIIADRPAFHSGVVLEGNSPNHAGQGQNVLFADGHSSFHPTRKVSAADDDLFLNQHNRPGYGVSPEDASLIPAVFRVRAD